MFLIALPFGAFSIYGAVWRQHCRKLEPSLFRTIIQEDIENGHSLEFDELGEIDFEGLEYQSDLENELYGSEPTSLPARKTPEIEPFEICFFFSRPGHKVLVPAEKTLLEQIDLDYVRAGEVEHHFYVKIIEWIDWNTVILDFGSVRGPLNGGGARGMKLQYVDGKWIIIEEGSYWVS